MAPRSLSRSSFTEFIDSSRPKLEMEGGSGWVWKEESMDGVGWVPRILRSYSSFSWPGFREVDVTSLFTLKGPEKGWVVFSEFEKVWARGEWVLALENVH